MYVVASVTDKSGVAQVRSETRDTFRAYLRDHPAHPEVVVHHAGPTLADDGESIVGLLLVMEAPSLDEARAFVADSPFAKADIFAESQVCIWDWTTGRPG